MARPKKKKVATAETTAEDDPEIEDDTGVTGTHLSGVDESNSAARADQLPSDAAHNRWRKAIEEHAEKLFVAKHFKKRAKEKLEKAKLAKRLYDAKMRRLEAGDKLKRRKKTFGAARISPEDV